MAARARRKPGPGTFELHQLKDGQCRYPCTSHGSDHRFCGQRTAIGGPNKYGSWCSEHIPVVFTPLAIARGGR